MIDAASARAFERCVASGGVALFPADTVYGLACAPDDARAVERLYGLKGRSAEKPAAVMYFDSERALAALPELGPKSRAVLERLLPGGVTLLLANPRRRFPLACGPDPATLGLRVPALAGALAALTAVRVPVMQSSANRSGEPDARRLPDVPEPVRSGVDLAVDGGELPGTPSTVVDLRSFERDGAWSVVRQGAVSVDALAEAIR